MMIIILENVPKRLRGELTRWLLEPYPNIFIGHVSARVRDYLWEKCRKDCKNGGVVQAWSTNTEQRFAIRMDGNTKRSAVDMEGLQLVFIPENTVPTHYTDPNEES
jgi:CRISPR-associated protein Cas2